MKERETIYLLGTELTSSLKPKRVLMSYQTNDPESMSIG